MIIGGIQKNSLIDYPSKISCVLFTSGCNFRCPYCHNPDLVNPPFQSTPMEAIYAFLERRKSLLDGVVITGGEPTLHDDLPGFCTRIKSLGYCVKLDTNGSRPAVVQALIEKEQIDYIAMDVKTLPDNYVPHIAPTLDPHAIMESISLILNSGLAHEFRTTCVRPFVNPPVIEKISHLIRGADLLAFQQAKITDSVLNPEFFREKDWKISTDTLKSFQTIAAPFVKKTIIR